MDFYNVNSSIMFCSELKYSLLTWYHSLEKRLIKFKQRKEFADLKNKAISHVERIDKKPIPVNKNEIRLFAIMRNESLRLPYFIKYYKRLGVDRFFFLDNNSTDSSAEIIELESNAHLFSTTDSYKNHWYWMEHLLETYGNYYWCVVVDIDELFYYPYAPKISLREFCSFLDDKKEAAVHSPLLDMYSDKVVSDAVYGEGQNPLDIVSHFDQSLTSQQFSFQDRKQMEFFTATIFTGGMRDRIFGVSNPPSILSKVSLFKYLPDTYLVQGMHAINNAKISEIQGVVFHTKFLSDFIQEVKEECDRGQHYGEAFYYKIFNRKLEEDRDISFRHEGSVKFEASQQLIDLGIMKTTEEFDAFAKEILCKKERI